MTVTFSDKTTPITPPLLGAEELPPYKVLNPEGMAKCLLICDHASSRIPAKLENLGLDEADLARHTALDIGAAYVTERLSAILDAPAIIANYSRLVIDCNRRLDHPTAFLMADDVRSIPRNVMMTEQDKALRIKEIYEPYHRELDRRVRDFMDRDVVPAVISIHSFSPVFYKQVRPWDLGFLWVQDPRLPLPAIEYFRQKGYTVGDNEPYDARVLRGTTVNIHADAHRLPNALVEIRNDLIDSENGGDVWAEMLGDCFKQLLRDEMIHRYYDGPDRPYDPEREQHYFEELIKKAKRGE